MAGSSPDIQENEEETFLSQGLNRRTKLSLSLPLSLSKLSLIRQKLEMSNFESNLNLKN